MSILSFTGQLNGSDQIKPYASTHTYDARKITLADNLHDYFMIIMSPPLTLKSEIYCFRDVCRPSQ